MNLTISRYFFSTLLTLLNFLFTTDTNCAESNFLLDYGNAKYYYYKSSVNNLYINIEGRMRLINKENGDIKTYFLLAPHPRESTWEPNLKPYSSIIEKVSGASMITVIAEKDGKFVISRRYESPTDIKFLHECIDSPYGNDLLYEPKQLQNDSLRELLTTDDIRAAALKQYPLYATLTYEVGATEVFIDFPIVLVNINPQISDFSQQWQAVSSRIPLYIGGDSGCDGIREGHVAIRDNIDTFEFVYLCQKLGNKIYNDFNCTFESAGLVRLYTKN